jgi:PleD family two-component response regulator
VVVSAVLLIVVLCLSAAVLRGARCRRELELELAELRALTRVEAATMLGNHQAFTVDLEREISRAARTGRPASLVILGLDPQVWLSMANGGGRGAVYGTIGSDADGRGAVAGALRSEVRDVDAGYRIGADEFALILPETRARGALVAVGRIEERLRGAGAPGAVTAGIAELGPGIDRHQLFRNAYCALLAAGHEGRPRLLVYSPELERPSREPGPRSDRGAAPHGIDPRPR